MSADLDRDTDVHDQLDGVFAQVAELRGSLSLVDGRVTELLELINREAADDA